MVHSLPMTKHVSKFLAVAGLLVVALLILAISPLAAQAQRLPDSQAQIDLTFAPLVKQASPAVVNVYSQKTVQAGPTPMEMFLYGRAMPQSRVQNSLGSGVIVRSDGVIVTNNHVIDGADSFRVVLSDRREYPAELVLADERTDLAVLKIDVGGDTLPVLNFADTRASQVGDLVLAIGNPFGVGQTVTSGIVSATARTDVGISDYAFFIQTDAAVNPGNSGGALVDANGQLVGINSAIASTTGAYSGYSFAIPSNIVRKVANDLLEFGSVQRAYIGVSIRDMDQKLADEVGLDRIKGVYVNGITDGGAAQKAGMQAGDVIVKVGSIEVNNVPQLQEQVGKFRPGNNVPVTVLRKGQEQVFDMTLRGKEGTTVASVNTRSVGSTTLGAEFSSVSAAELKSLGLGNGVKVKAINGGKFRSSGIKEGFIITRIDQQDVKDPSQLTDLLENKRGGVLVEGVYPNGTRAYYGLGL